MYTAVVNSPVDFLSSALRKCRSRGTNPAVFQFGGGDDQSSVFDLCVRSELPIVVYVHVHLNWLVCIIGDSFGRQSENV